MLSLTSCVCFICSIAYIWQADLFEVAYDGMCERKTSPGALNIVPELSADCGGKILPHAIPREVVLRETADDPQLREYIEAGTVPTVDTIFR